MCPCSCTPRGPNLTHVPRHVPLLMYPAGTKSHPCAPSCAPAHVPRGDQISPMCPVMCPCSCTPRGPNLTHVPIHVPLLMYPAGTKSHPCAHSCAPAHVPRGDQISPM